MSDTFSRTSTPWNLKIPTSKGWMDGWHAEIATRCTLKELCARPEDWRCNNRSWIQAIIDWTPQANNHIEIHFHPHWWRAFYYWAKLAGPSPNVLTPSYLVATSMLWDEMSAGCKTCRWCWVRRSRWRGKDMGSHNNNARRLEKQHCLGPAGAIKISLAESNFSLRMTCGMIGIWRKTIQGWQFPTQAERSRSLDRDPLRSKTAGISSCLPWQTGWQLGCPKTKIDHKTLGFRDYLWFREKFLLKWSITWFWIPHKRSATGVMFSLMQNCQSLIASWHITLECAPPCLFTYSNTLWWYYW